jgi:predicted nucleic acid-binding protein
VTSTRLFTSALVVGEIRAGIESIRRRDGQSALFLDEWLSRIVSSFADRILPVDLRIAERWGRMSVPDPLPVVDGLLAATALVHDMTLVTRDVHAIERTGVKFLDPWSA